jgi:hypothetical protein
MKKRMPVPLVLGLYAVFLILVGAFLINVLGLGPGGIYSGLGGGFGVFAVYYIHNRRSSLKEAPEPGQK